MDSPTFNTRALSYTPDSPSQEYHDYTYNTDYNQDYFRQLLTESDIKTIPGRNTPYRKQLDRGIKVVVFDPYEELIWTGLNSGRIVSYCYPTAEKYTSWQAFNNYGVRDMLLDDHGVYSIGFSGIRMSTRGGLLKFNYENPGIKNLHCMGWWGDKQNSKIFIGGSGRVVMFDSARRKVEKEVMINSAVTCVDKKRSMVFGTEDGKIYQIDPRILKPNLIYQNSTDDSISDIAVKDYLVAACMKNQYDVDIYNKSINLYDIRRMDYKNPIKLHIPGMLVNFHPQYSTIVSASETGYFQSCTVDQWPPYLDFPSQVKLQRGSKITSFDISTNGNMMVFADQIGNFYVWGYSTSTINDFSRPTVFGGTPPINQKRQNFISILEESDKSSLLSNWTANKYFSPSIPYVGLSKAFTDKIQMRENVGYVLSYGEPSYTYNRPQVDQTDDYSVERNHKINFKKKSTTNIKRIPKKYRRVHVKQKLLIDSMYDPEVQSRFNSTEYSGLENTLPNSYINNLIQLLNYIPQFRLSCENHLCEVEYCLCCELGLLFKNIQQSGRQITEARNFLRSLYAIPSAKSADIFEEDSQLEYYLMIGKAMRLIFETLGKEFHAEPVSYNKETVGQKNDIMNIMFGSRATCINECPYCFHIHTNRILKYYYDISNKKFSIKNQKFYRLLEDAFMNSSETNFPCQNCGIYQKFELKNETVSLPNTLMLNFGTMSFDFWKSLSDPDHLFSMKDLDSNWLPSKFCAYHDGHRIRIQRYEPSHAISNVVRYVLKGVISNIQDVRHAEDFLVTQVNVQTSEDPKWVMFNDFSVDHVNIEEVVYTSSDWKIPVIVCYVRDDLDNVIPVPEPLDLLGDDIFFVPGLNQGVVDNPNYEPLKKDDFPLQNKIVAIDSEFVSLASEQIMEARGKSVIIRPRIFSAARISILRTWDDETAFIDDYINTDENMIEDFLTHYSGLYPGDLNVKESKHEITTSKIANLKLRRLIDLGCIFIGHGLSTDFKILNVVVPPDQVIDTVRLFHKKSEKRLLKLSFLSSIILGSDIQLVVHDSIEDSVAAYNLYKEYQKYESLGISSKVIDKLYKIGLMIDWDVENIDETTKSNFHQYVNNLIDNANKQNNIVL